ncbi:Hypothetical protein NTJ_05470 [Nesidiocoris tenuis]|uniref:Uncharacterized protein n=1 Tax=Nesidiocoris tenuis TaxID=355587 RepID=A0ABN7AK84_9HEMI|nr:Hypothetical protein NTJ_05470 [Nesidiocoris tenuis]
MSKTIPDRFIFNEDKIATNQEQHTLKKTAQSQDLDLGSRLVVKDLSRFKILEVPWNRPTTSNCSKQTSSEPEQEGHALALDSEPMTGHFIIKSFNRTALREKCDEYKNICPQARNMGDGSWYQRPIVRMAKRRSRLTRKGEQLDLATKCVLELLTSSEEDISTQ